nr:uncharacterized protein LOC110360292 isoform X2 [Columba livia]
MKACLLLSHWCASRPAEAGKGGEKPQGALSLVEGSGSLGGIGQMRCRAVRAGRGRARTPCWGQSGGGGEGKRGRLQGVTSRGAALSCSVSSRCPAPFPLLPSGAAQGARQPLRPGLWGTEPHPRGATGWFHLLTWAKPVQMYSCRVKIQLNVVLFKLCKVEKQYEIQDVQMGYPSSVGLISAEEVARYLQIRGRKKKN